MTVHPPAHPLDTLAAVTPRWAVLVTPPLPGADNMALDHALMLRATRTGEAVLRIYTWRQPTLSFGRHETAIGAYDPAAIAAAGLAVVRRPTGGRAVLHDDEITYSVTAPLSAEQPRRAHARALYAAINVLLLHGLARLGVSAELAVRDPGPSTLRSLGTGPCFDTASDGEVVVAGQKLVGSAQWREDGAVLQHGSMLISGHRARLAALSDRRSPGTVIPAAMPAPAAALRDLLPRVPAPTDVALAFGAVLGDALADAGAPAARIMFPGPETAAMTASMRSHYEDDAWTWRR
jgi:lipoyl(octanoyl) transferase